MKKLLFVTGMFTLFMLQSCYYDNMEDLYPDNGGTTCDTTNVTFNLTVWPIIQSNCTGCHSGSAPSGNVSLENYNDVVVSVENNKLMGTIRHESGYSPMPKNSSRLSDCNISQLETWINHGYPDN